MTYPLSQIEGMAPFAAAKLKKLGIRTTDALLEAARTVKGRSANVEMQESFPDSPASWTVAVTNRGDKKSGDASRTAGITVGQ